MLDAASASARDALARTPDQLPVLKEAGVVDAGGMGLVVVLQAFADALAGRSPQAVPHFKPPSHAPVARTRARETGSSEFAYEVQYLLDASDEKVPGLRNLLGTVGDSVAIVGGGGTWKVHVHTNDIGRAIELGVETGRPSQISVMAFEDQIAARAQRKESVGGIPLARPGGAAALIVVANGAGLTRLFRDLGAALVVEGGGRRALSRRHQDHHAGGVLLSVPSSRGSRWSAGATGCWCERSGSPRPASARPSIGRPDFHL
jgi:dihydroxyacetone kinase-like predicted kinase